MAICFTRTTIWLLNTFGFFCFRFDRNRIEVSRLRFAFNTAKGTIPALTFIYFVFNPSLQIYVYGFSFDRIYGFSSFSIKLVLILATLQHFSSVALSFIYLRKTTSVLDFVNRLARFSLQEKLLGKLRRDWTRSCLLMVTVCLTVFFTTLFGIVRIEAKAVLLDISLSWPYFTVSMFILFMKLSETLFLALLNSFKIELETFQETHGQVGLENLKARYESIKMLNDEFNVTFEPGMTLVACCASSAATLQVGETIKKKAAFYFLPFKLYQSVQTILKVPEIGQIVLAMVSTLLMFGLISYYIMSSGDQFDRESANIIRALEEPSLQVFL